eukprot:COSAG04_NODE_18728_length_434_cov_0.513433_1_plen_111_part_10
MLGPVPLRSGRLGLGPLGQHPRWLVAPFTPAHKRAATTLQRRQTLRPELSRPRPHHGAEPFTFRGSSHTADRGLLSLACPFRAVGGAAAERGSSAAGGGPCQYLCTAPRPP